MPLVNPPEVLKALAHELRWTLLSRLAQSDYRVHELVETTGQPANLVSYHLKQLRVLGLVAARRGEADGRDTYYRADLSVIGQQLGAAGAALHPALGSALPAHPLPTRHVLFVCTHNSARSQMAEGLLRHLSGGQFVVQSAGSQPTRVRPEAVETMAALGIDISGQQAKSFAAVADQAFDVVITVCDRAREVCPAFEGATERLHWGFPDPMRIDDLAERQAAFAHTAHLLEGRIRYFLQTLRHA